MGSLSHSVCVVLCFWSTVISNVHQNVGPCAASPRQVSFNCSQRMLTAIPGQIWDNVTALDISQNNLNLTHPKTIVELHRFHRLVVLNLSGNYLPLLGKDSLGVHSFLEVLDLSRCQMGSIESGALWGLPMLQALFLGHNLLHDPLPNALKDLNKLSFLDLYGNHLKAVPPSWINKVKNVFWPANSNGMAPGKKNEELEQEFNNFRLIQRKLLSDLTESTYLAEMNDTDIRREQSSKSWVVMMAVVVSAIAISILVALAAKSKLLHQYLTSYRHTRLAESDATSQGVPAGHEMSASVWDVPEFRPGNTVCEEPDDDGFIEDNYIQESERQRAERPVDIIEDSDSDSDIHFSIS